MKIVEVKNVRIGEGRPKVCVPILGATRDELVQQGKSVLEAPVDIVEWRGDCFPDIFNKAKTLEALKALREILQDIPLLFTFRTSKEGGATDISSVEYSELNRFIISTGFTDLIDIEAFTGEKLVRDIIREAHDNGVKVIASNHDFHKTPSKEEIIRRLRYMKDLGADICKIALMPENKRDVLTLLEATLEMYESYGDTPIITMSMGREGVISRISGELFGSAVTFGSLEKASAPGQIKIKELSQLLDLLHNNLQ